MGDAFVGAIGGMMVYNALTGHNNHSSGASATQIEQAKQDQRIEDKLDRVLDQQQAPAPPVVMAQAPMVQQAVQQPQCQLPEDAPLMMAPSFYCPPQNNR